MSDMRTFMNLLKEEQVLDEMPIQHFQTIGDFSKTASFKKPEDMKLVNNPKAVAKTHKRFAACDLDFHFYFVNTKEVRDHLEVGMVNPHWLQKNMPEAWAEIEPSISGDAINCIFTNNRGDERYPMTAWIIAHRLGHALRREEGSRSGLHWAFDDLDKVFRKHTREILAHFNIQPQRGDRYGAGANFNKFARNLFHAIGTMKSARDGNLRNADEFIYEMIAQYIFSGEVKMNTLKGGIYSHSTWGHRQHRYPQSGDREGLDYAVENFADEMNSYIEQLLHSCVGHIFVM